MEPDSTTVTKSSPTRRLLPWTAALLGVTGAIALGVKLVPSGKPDAAKSAEQAAHREQERRSAALAHLEALLEDKWNLGIKPSDIPRDELEIELSARMADTPENLRSLIEIGKKGRGPLIQAGARLLAGDLDGAIQSADQVTNEKTATPERTIQATAIKAAALDQKGEFMDALAARRKVGSLLDPEKSTSPWLEATVQVTRMLSKLDRDAEACDTLKKAIEFTDARPDVSHEALIPALNHYALCLIRTRSIKSDEVSGRALQLAEEHLPPDHFLLVSSLHTRGEFFSRKKPYTNAMPFYLRACEIEEKRFGKDHLARADRLRHFGMYLSGIHKPREAEVPLRRSLQIRDSYFKDARDPTINHLLSLGSALTALNKFVDGEPILRRAVETSKTLHGTGHRQTVTSLTRLATHIHSEQRPHEAEMLYREAIDAWTDHHLEFQEEALTAMSHLVLILTNRQEFGEATFISSKALELCRSKHGFFHPETARLLNHHGLILNGQGQWNEAITYFNQSLKITEKIHGPFHDANISKLQNLAWSLENLGKKGEPGILRRRALLIALTFRKRTQTFHEHEKVTTKNYRDYLLRQGDSTEEIENDIEQVKREAGLFD